MGLEQLPVFVEGFRNGRNFRDLGGWRIADDHVLVKGRIYRSGRLDNLTTAETLRLTSLGLRTIVDLRSRTEASAHPDPPLLGTRLLRVDAGRRAAGEDLGEDAVFEDLVQDKVRASVEMAFDNPALETICALLLAQGRTPLLFHCNSGKDRTGIVAMIVLMALGASDETILLDYLLSNAYRHAEIAWSQSLVPDFDQLSPEQQGLYTIMQGVIPLVGQSVLASIDANYASRAAYLEAECGLDAEALNELRRRYHCRA